VSLAIKDGDRIVARASGETTTGTHTFQWDGTDAAGSDLEDGVYTLEITATNADGDNLQTEIRSAGRVTGVDMSGSEVQVQMGQISVPLSYILTVREQQAVQNDPESGSGTTV
jgi:flagellar basal-body rod modification protein FlgD